MAWDSIESWQAEVELTHRLPLPRLVKDAAVCLAFAMGFAAARSEQDRLAGELICFAIVLDIDVQALLRPSEMYNVTVGRLGVPPSSRHRRSRRHILERYWRLGSVHIPRPKTFRSFGRSQFATFKGRRPRRWAAWIMPGVPRGRRVFPGAG